MRAQFKSNKSFGDTHPQVGGARGPMASELVDMVEWPKNGNSLTLRLIGPVVARGVHKVKVIKKDGTQTEISKTCLAFNVETEEKDSKAPCPYCRMDADMARFSKIYFINAIVRSFQEDQPNKVKPPTKEEAATGFKSMSSDTWTPVRVLRAPSSVALRFQQLGAKNKVKGKSGEPKAFGINDVKYGRDIEMSFDKSLPPANMYSADPTESPSGEKFSPLSEEERDYLLYDMEPLWPSETLDVAKEEAKGLIKRFGKTAQEPEDDDDDEPAPRKGKTREKDMEFDDDEDEKPAKGARKSAKSAEPDEQDDQDEEELDFDDEPKAKKSSKASVKGKSKSVAAEDEDEDDGFEDTPKSKKKGKPESDFDEDEDEEETPPKKSSKTPVKGKSKAAVEEEDDDFDEQEEDDEDEDEDEKKKPASKVKGKAAKAEPEDELDDLDEDEQDEEQDEQEEEAPPARKKSTRR